MNRKKKILYGMLFLFLMGHSIISILQRPIGRWGVKTFGVGARPGAFFLFMGFHIMYYTFFAAILIRCIFEIVTYNNMSKRDKTPDMAKEIKVKKAVIWSVIFCIIFNQLFGIWV